MTAPTRLTVDHVTLAGADLDAMRERFAALGLITEYGGPHDNRITHMALLGFDDGSYLELIAALSNDAASPLWAAQIAGNAGPAAWCVRIDDLNDERSRLTAAGIGATGPVPMQRERPDGTQLAWELLFPGGDPPGATLPFAIADRTPRSLRVAPSSSVAGSELVGVGMVVLGVHQISEAAQQFQAAYHWPPPSQHDAAAGWGAQVAHFTGTPVTLAQPSAAGTWLAERLQRYAESPCAFLLATRDFRRTVARLPLINQTTWFGHRVAWIDPQQLFGWHLGVIAL